MIICYLPPIKGTRKLHWYYKQIRYLYVPRFMINTLPPSALGRVKWCKDHRESSCIYHDNIIYIYFSWIDDGHVDATIAMGVFRYAIHVQSSANAWKIHLYPSGVWYQVPWLFGPTARSVSHSWKNSRHPHRRKGLELRNFKVQWIPTWGPW